jgi:hypothetical protein
VNGGHDGNFIGDNGPLSIIGRRRALTSISKAFMSLTASSAAAALEEQRNGEWRYLEFLQVTSLITADIFVREIPGRTRARHRSRIGPAQLTCPNPDTDHSDQSVPVLFAPLFLEGRRAPADEVAERTA